MTGEIDNLLNSMGEQKKNKRNEEQQLFDKQNAFVSRFRKIRDDVIHPAMMGIVAKLRKKGFLALWLRGRRQKSNPLQHVKEFTGPPKQDAAAKMLYRHYENYYIGSSELAQGMAMIIAVLGNYSTEQVCVITEYVKHNGNKPSTSVKKTMEQFTLAQITTELFDTIVAARMKEIQAIRQQLDENKPLL